MPPRKRKRDPYRRHILAPRIKPALYRCEHCHDGELLDAALTVCPRCGVQQSP